MPAATWWTRATTCPECRYASSGRIATYPQAMGSATPEKDYIADQKRPD